MTPKGGVTFRDGQLPRENRKPMHLTLPPGLIQRVREVATANKRTLTAQMELYLERGLDIDSASERKPQAR